MTPPVESIKIKPWLRGLSAHTGANKQPTPGILILTFPKPSHMLYSQMYVPIAYEKHNVVVLIRPPACLLCVPHTIRAVLLRETHLCYLRFLK